MVLESSNGRWHDIDKSLYLSTPLRMHLICGLPIGVVSVPQVKLGLLSNPVQGVAEDYPYKIPRGIRGARPSGVITEFTTQRRFLFLVICRHAMSGNDEHGQVT
jgi:hypothetical protein